MIRSYRSEALIIRKVKRGEADSVITVLTRRQGLRVVFAKGIRRLKSKRAPFLDLFNHVVLYLSKGKTYDIVTDVEPIDNFGILKTHLSRVAGAFKISELTNRLLPESQSHEVIFDKVLNLFLILNQVEDQDEEKIINGFGNFLLQELGFIPQSLTLTGKDIDRTLEEVMEKKIKTNLLLAKLV